MCFYILTHPTPELRVGKGHDGVSAAHWPLLQNCIQLSGESGTGSSMITHKLALLIGLVRVFIRPILTTTISRDTVLGDQLSSSSIV